jgi:hypothetical protein
MAPQLKSDLATAGLLEGPSGGIIPQFLDTRDAARLLNVSVSFLNKARLTGGGPSYAKFGFQCATRLQRFWLGPNRGPVNRPRTRPRDAWHPQKRRGPQPFGRLASLAVVIGWATRSPPVLKKAKPKINPTPIAASS